MIQNYPFKRQRWVNVDQSMSGLFGIVVVALQGYKLGSIVFNVFNNDSTMIFIKETVSFKFLYDINVYFSGKKLDSI